MCILNDFPGEGAVSFAIKKANEAALFSKSKEKGQENKKAAERGGKEGTTRRGSRDPRFLVHIFC